MLRDFFAIMGNILGQMHIRQRLGEKYMSKERKLKMKGKYMMTAAVLMSMMAFVGCTREQTKKGGETVLLSENQGGENTPEDTEQESLDEDREENIGSETTGDSKKREDREKRELIFIGGKVRRVLEDSFVISRTLWEESEDGQGAFVVIPEAGSPEEELVTIRCTDSVLFEQWIIGGGGADIIKEAASFSQVQEGGGVEAQGYFDGEEFVAEKVFIEIYE